MGHIEYHARFLQAQKGKIQGLFQDSDSHFPGLNYESVKDVNKTLFWAK
jgi:hypothetical protein